MERKPIMRRSLLSGNDGMVEEVTPQSEPLVSGVVERGRSVMVPIPGSKKFIQFHPESGQPIYAQNERRAGPNETVTLPKSEMDALRAQGFIIDPNNRLPDATVGPEFDDAVGANRKSGRTIQASG